MKEVLLFGAGKSATLLIEYLLANAQKEGWRLTVADGNPALAASKINNHPSGRVVAVNDLNDETERRNLIANASIVISMLPPGYHILIAKDCLALKNNLLTASYIDEEMLALRAAVEEQGLLFLCEMGLDPGLDHMSAMQVFDRIRDAGGTITSYRSHCGGLIAPESDTNPWHYKVSWNPRNITLAGHAGAVFKEDNIIKELPYQTVFENCPVIEVPTLGKWACYPNRNSLAYIPIYKLESARTVLRSTLRHPDFCMAWQYIVIAGLSNPLDGEIVENYKGKSIRDWFTGRLNFYTGSANFKDFLKRYVEPKQQALVENLFNYLGLFSQEMIPARAMTSADILQYLLETRLALDPNDRDMIIMIHEIEFTLNDVEEKIFSSLIVKGDNALNTAMAKTVGLPLGAATRLILNGTIQAKGVQIPTVKEVYEPVLKELAQNGIEFYEEEYF